MLNSFTEALNLVLAVCALVGIIFHIANTKSNIEKLVDEVKDDLKESLSKLATDIKVSQAKQEGKKEMTEYLINDLYDQIHHKFYRAWDEIKDIQDYLQKDGFMVRKRYNREKQPQPKKIKIEEI